MDHFRLYDMSEPHSDIGVSLRGPATEMSDPLRPLHRAVRHLNLSSVLQRALRTLELWLAQMSRRRRRQELHMETAAGGAPSVMVSISYTLPGLATLGELAVCMHA